MGSFSTKYWAGLVVIAVIVYLAANSQLSPKKSNLRNADYVCRNCGTRAKPKIVTRGSVWIELILWLAMIIPGVIYSIWRITTRDIACPECQRNTMIGAHTPIGRMIARRYNADMLDDRIEHHL